MYCIHSCSTNKYINANANGNDSQFNLQYVQFLFVDKFKKLQH